MNNAQIRSDVWDGVLTLTMLWVLVMSALGTILLSPLLAPLWVIGRIGRYCGSPISNRDRTSNLMW